MPVDALSSTTKSTKNTKTSFLDRINKIDRMLYRAQSCESCNPVQNTSCTALRSLRLKTNTSAALFLTAEIAENAEKKALFVFFVAKTMAPRFAWAGGAAASRPCVDGEAAVPPDRWIADGEAAVPPERGGMDGEATVLFISNAFMCASDSCTDRVR